MIKPDIQKKNATTFHVRPKRVDSESVKDKKPIRIIIDESERREHLRQLRDWGIL